MTNEELADAIAAASEQSIVASEAGRLMLEHLKALLSIQLERAKVSLSGLSGLVNQAAYRDFGAKIKDA